MRPRPRLVSCGPNTTLFEAVNGPIFSGSSNPGNSSGTPSMVADGIGLRETRRRPAPLQGAVPVTGRVHGADSKNGSPVRRQRQ